MIIKRNESWGIISYNTKTHRFSYIINKNINEQPYVKKPLVLNIYLTFKCNMNCRHCIIKDMKGYDYNDLIVTDDLINDINQSPFLVIVITGGEPLLYEYEQSLIKLVNGIQGKGIVIDTNGTIMPNEKLISVIKRKNALLRISLDSVRKEDETKLRRSHKTKDISFHNKLNLIPTFKKKGMKVAIQSVVHKQNLTSINNIIDLMQLWGIQLWYLQRPIPTKTFKPKDNNGEDQFFLEQNRYEQKVDELAKYANNSGIVCISKKDRRHNCVFLMGSDGTIYSASDSKPERFSIGKIGGILDYFEYVSAADHSVRYFLYNKNVGAEDE